LAGIGFELKKLFSKRGVFESVKAYGYATVVCAGPMLLGVLLLLGLMFLCSLAGIDQHTREVLICMITYTLLASLTATSFFSMVITRYTADMLYEDKKLAVLPSFWGSTVVMLAVGCILYALFLLFSGATLLQQLFCYTFFGELIITWNATSYLTAIKDYKGIFLSFFAAIVSALIIGGLLVLLKAPVIEALLFAVTVGYGIMSVWHIILLHRYFPKSDLGAFNFLKWIDKFWSLALSGLFTNIGMFAHIVIMWGSRIGVNVLGLFYGAPFYDVPALLSFLTILITTVNFVVSVEVNFYPKYRTYYSLYNDKGAVNDILQAEEEMITTLKTEIFYTALKQLLFSAVCIAVSGFILDVLPLGFNELMRGYFRTLCVGYGMYAIGNMLMLILLYFADYTGALYATGAFAGASIVFTFISTFLPNAYFGFGFLLASFIFTVVAVIRLDYFTKRLPYYILAVQPLVEEDKSGFFERMGAYIEEQIERVGKNEVEWIKNRRGFTFINAILNKLRK